MHIETEIKFSLDEDRARKILSSRLVKRATRQKKKSARYLSTYYDTRQHLLRKAMMALRIRNRGGKLEQTIKVPASGAVGMLNFEEWTVPLAVERPDLSQVDASVMARFNPRNRALKLQPLFTTVIDRSVIVLEYKKSLFELAYDNGVIECPGDPRRAEPVCEIEFELLRGSPLAMLDFTLALNEQHEIYPEHRTKAQRGYALARPSLKPKPTKARHVLLDPTMTAGQSFHRIITDALWQLYNNEIPTIEGMPGGIHQARVSIRRIRAALRAFKKCLPYDKRKAFNGEFRWFQLRLARARDWHVFLSETLPHIEAGKPNARINLDRLQKLARTERRRATREAMEVFRSKRYTRLVLQFQRFLMTLNRENRKLLETDVSSFAQSVLKKTRRDFLVDTRPLSRMPIEEVHELRKRGKKARYATEFFADLWDPEQVRPYVRTMADIQNQLGKVNDAAVSRQVIASVPPRGLKSSTHALVQEWSEQQTRDCIKEAQVVWRRFQRQQPFWLSEEA